MAQKLSEIRNLLAAHGLRPKHRLGQNFLHDHAHLARIVEAAELSEGDLVLEVGPGTGTLSQAVLAAGAKLVMVEVDADLAPILGQQVLDRAPDRARLLVQDVLARKRAVDPAVLAALRELAGVGPDQPEPAFKLIANLPYHVASPLVANLVVDHPGMGLAVVMIQREVADRLAAEPGGKAYGPLGVMVQAMCHVERVSVLSPGSFWPKPEVESAVVRLVRRQTPLTDDPAALQALLQKLFTQRRKQLGRILGRSAALPGGIDPNDRPERLSVEQLVALSRLY